MVKKSICVCFAVLLACACLLLPVSAAEESLPWLHTEG